MPSSAASTPSIPEVHAFGRADLPPSMFPAATACAWIRRNTAEGVVPPYYDSLIAKLIAHGCDRAEAIAKMERALSQFVVQGIETSISLHQEIFQTRPSAPGSSTPGSWSASLLQGPYSRSSTAWKLQPRVTRASAKDSVPGFLVVRPPRACWGSTGRTELLNYSGAPETRAVGAVFVSPAL